MGNFFAGDWHLNEPRITEEFNPFLRPFASVQEQNDTIINNCNKVVGENDTLYHVGDVSIDLDGLKLLDKIKCKRRILIIGNYDEDKLYELGNYFDSIQHVCCVKIKGRQYRLNHYPSKAQMDIMNIVGHVHGLWKDTKP